ncbi:uncharacterized protein CC84DRAFT_1264730 [Paraphaeosphaeria sporulosa]|uniref:SAP domain-containing protein n=1 Tax=Paraphaeosphaeria sporulosa TaxID=1460663 RepID=A0A177BVH9_9PLEO|nr:uncharacterized protein CC84DRAFT_1264730 [Paraphaeosphaeria sporulosa]OAF98731.1 hypothetical protein CC84DRAFT_1264730 [Paraphaeosphaeria sporulosa]
MRLTVKVLPLTAANAPGPYQAEALAAFQQRVFALPVDAADTFELVWRKIEDRYKNNYLAPQHVALFAIKKLQDGRDCDLDLTDTVGSIFADEAVADRVVKVVPSFANRLFSMPPDTNLRPNPHKRSRFPSDAPANKRPRQHPPSAQVDMDAVADGPVPSVESDGARAHRSHTGGSVTLLSAARRGQPQFTTHIKSESPELGAITSPGALKKPAQQSYDMPVNTPDRPSSQAVSTIPRPSPFPKLKRRQQRHSNQKSSESRTTQSTSASTPYGKLKKSELRELLLTRGLKTQENGKRNKDDLVQRLLAYDAQVDDTTIQETPQGKGRPVERKHVSPKSTEKIAIETLRGPPNHEVNASSSNRPDWDKPSSNKPNSKLPSPSKPSSKSPSSSRPSPSKPNSASSSPTRLNSTSPSPTRPDSNRSSPLAAREPAQWLAKSPSPHRLESDADSGESRASSCSQSPVDNLNGDTAMDQDTSDSESNTKSDEDGEVNGDGKVDEEDEVDEEGGVEEKAEVDKLDVNRSPSPADLGAPPSAQLLRSSVVPDTPSSSTQLPASQPPPRSVQSNGGINAWFTSASQPLVRSGQARSQPPSASQPVLPRRGPRNTGIFSSLKEMLKQTREQPNEVSPVHQPKRMELKATDLGNTSQKKLPSALEQDSEDDKSQDSRSSSSDEDS